MFGAFDLNEYDSSIQQKGKTTYHTEEYKAYTLSSIERIGQLDRVPEEMIDDMKVVAYILPFKVNNYVVNELINWSKVPNDPIFRMTFPQKGMLLPHHYERMKKAIEEGSKSTIKEVAKAIRLELNPNPAGQKTKNVPCLGEEELKGVQHKYRETVLFFPRKGQACHAYCTFCFRWSQFVRINGEQKFAMENLEQFITYLQNNPTATDVLFTGGDPMTLRGELLESYIQPLLDADIRHLRNLRIGSKVLSYWPYKLISDKDTDLVLDILSRITDNDLNLAFMAHFNHYQELQTEALEIAVNNLLKTGAQIRTQSPLLNHINADPKVWATLWQKQVDLDMIPYYMFVARDTGAQHYFSVPLVRTWAIFKKAYSRVSGICRTVRGPSMSCTPGKVCINGVSRVKGKRVIVLRFIQGRNPAWVNCPFFAKYDPKAIWIDDLKPAFSEKFFFEEELEQFLAPYNEIKEKVKE